jgi:hypothetical protein
MEECRHKGCRIEAEVSKDQGCLCRVCHIRLTRSANLGAVRFNCKEKCVIDEASSLGRADPGDDLIAQRLAQGFNGTRKGANLCDWVSGRSRDLWRLFDGLWFDAHDFGE